MAEYSKLLKALLNWAQFTRLQERARDVSRSSRVYPILLLLVLEARASIPAMDGRAAPLTRKVLLECLRVVFHEKISREALRKLLNTLVRARMVELNGSLVRASRALLADIDALAAPPNAITPAPSGA